MKFTHLLSQLATLTMSLIFVSCSQAPVADVPAKKVFVVLRYDDFSQKSNFELEKKILSLCVANKMPCTFGVIPNVIKGSGRSLKNGEYLPLDDEHIQFLKDGIKSGYLTVALHGWTHQTVSSKKASEFVGVPYDKQLYRIKRGKEYLEEKLETKIDAFIPPWNSYDENTLKAVEAAGFKVFSADERKIANRSDTLLFVPATAVFTQLRPTVEKALKQDDKSFVNVYFHDYEFSKSKSMSVSFNFAEFQNTIQWMASQKNVQGVGMVDIAEGCDTYTAKAYLHQFGVFSFLHSSSKSLPVKNQCSRIVSAPKDGRRVSSE